MPLPDLAANTVVLVTFMGNCNGQRIINTFHYRAATAPLPGTPYDSYMNRLFIGLNGIGGLIQRFIDCMSANYTLEGVRLQPVYPTRQRYIYYPLLLSGNFPVFLATAQNSAASIKRVSNVVGPSGVGRIQMVIPEQQASGGVVVDVNGYVTALQTLGGQFLPAIVTATPTMTWNPCLYGPGYVTTGVCDLVNWQVEDTVRTMHRRTNFLGE